LKRASLAALAALMAVAAFVAGCGGGDSDSTTATLTKAAFIKQGDAICAKATKESEAEAEEFADENGFKLEKATEEQLEEAITDVLVPSLNKQAEELDALGAPAGDEEQVEEIVTSLEDAAGEVEDDPNSVLTGKALKKPSQLAKSYGFKVCGEK
jgi:hypothetical protein